MYQYSNIKITGGHQILVDVIDESTKLKSVYPEFYDSTYMIDDKFLLLSPDSDLFSPIDSTEIYDIYHFILDGPKNHYGVYLEHGIISESFNIDVINDYIFN